MLGDRVERALSLAGLTQERVEAWLGRPCGCDERREKLNQIDAWARRVVSGRIARAREYLSGIMGESRGEG